MNPEQLTLLSLAIFAIAFLYSCVGHAGASGYIAVMSLFSLAPAVIKPTALSLNILVACIGTWHFWRAGHFAWRLFWPFAIPAIPMAFLGGYVQVPTGVFNALLGAVLLFSSARFFFGPCEEEVSSHPPLAISLPVGAGLGLLAGITGTGGGIFLTPCLLFMRWAEARPAAAVSALFILVNSASGLLGNLSSTRQFPSFAIWLAVSAVIGGSAGSYLGSQRLDAATIKRLLAVVLLVAGVKLILTR